MRNLALEAGKAPTPAVSGPEFEAGRPGLARLFLTFLRLGITAFGGPSMIAYIRGVAVDREKWLEPKTFADGVAFCQMIPGATAMQVAAYVGLRARGAIGAALCYFGFGLPAFLLMMLFAAVYPLASSLSPVISAFQGLQAVIVAVVANATLAFGRAALKSRADFLIAAGAAVLFMLNLNPLLVILLAAGAGLALNRARPPAGVQKAAPPERASLRPVAAVLAGALAGLGFLYFLDRPLFDLAILLARIDLTAFGGGLASVPLMLHEVVDLRHWLDAATFMNAVVLGQITPGPIVITATFIGYYLHGALGGITATVAIFLPSFVLVIGLAPFLGRLQNSALFQRGLGGVLCSFVGLLFAVIFRFGANVAWDARTVLLAAGALAALLAKVDLLWVILGGLVLSVILFS